MRFLAIQGDCLYGAFFVKGLPEGPFRLLHARVSLFDLAGVTPINVPLGSNGVSERLRSLSGFCCFFGLRIDGSIYLRVRFASPRLGW